MAVVLKNRRRADFGRSRTSLMTDINVTPMVDVMLVLLVIFIITAPLLATAIKLDLPDVKAAPAAARGDAIRLTLDAEGRYFWNDQLVADDDMPRKLADAAKAQPQPELHLRADKDTRYDRLARLMSAAQEAGLARIGFVTDPPRDESASTPPVAAPAAKK